MRTIKVFISYIMIFAILLTIIPYNAIKVKAAASGNNLIVQSYRYNSGNSKYELTVSWQGAKSTKSANIVYNSDDAAGTLVTSANVPVVEVDTINLSTSKFTATFDVSALKEDFLYDIKVNTYDSLDSSGTLKMSGDIYFTTGITFQSERVDQTVSAGVYESGTSPELKLSWNVPNVWNGSAWVMATDPTAISYMNSIIKPAKSITKLDFKINISTKAQSLDSGADISPVFIQNDGSGTYMASDSSGTPKTATLDPVSETMSINIVGRKDLNDTPTFDPTDTRLYHNQIQPGTVYFMNIKPNFLAGTDLVDAITLGDPTQLNGSLVRDKASGLGYTYTPVRFKITRDAANNVYVTAYRINKDDGSIDMPNLYYSIQAIDTPIDTYGFDWPEKARMTDQFFPTGSQYAVTVITGVDVNTPMYYKVVVKTDSKSDRIESLKMLYKMSSDTSKPPIPINVKVDMTQSTLATGNVNDPASGSVIVDQYNNPLNVRTTDILLTWDKPANYESMSAADKADLVYHVMINTNVENLKLQYPLKFAGLEREYLLNYRWVRAISANDPGIVVDGNKLTYKIKGFELFKNIDGTSIKDPDKYPQWLIENTIYYVKMFTTKTMDASELSALSDLTGDGVIDEKDFAQYATNSGVTPENIVSQTSVPSSFTTLPGTDKQVPVPTGFKATGENVDQTTKKNYINLQFDRSIIDWNIFTSSGGNNEVYELFMAPGNGDDPQYIQIGSTDPSFKLASSEYTKAQITLVNGVWTVLVPGLRQNTTYRFKLRLKLDFGDPAISDMYSEYTAMVSVTTRKIDIVRPDDASKMPRAPVDFNIGKTSDGSPDLNGTGVGLDWSILEDDVSYQLVATSYRIDANADIPDFSSDAYYQDFIESFGKGTTDNVLDLEPSSITGGNFSVDLIAKNAKYRVEKFMPPNSIYFYSLRAVRTVYVKDASGNIIDTIPLYSQWVTVPVTTSMIEAPLNLETVQDYELGLSWEDSGTGAKPSDYKIYIKKSSETTYKPLDITKATIIKDDDGKTFYARITGLDANTEYNLGALKGTDASTLNFQKTWTMTTRDEYHNVEVRWKGVPGFTYVIAMRNESTGEEYSDIAATDFEFKTEKSQELVGTGYYYYYARIKKMPVKLSDGNPESFSLNSNTKYYIKVKATSTGVQSSNYTGPVIARTSFNQSDYDNNEDIENVKSKLVDKIDELEKKPYYSLNYVLSTTNTLLLKGDRLAEEIMASPYHEIDVDLTNVSSAGRRDVVYIPEYLAQTLKDSKGSISFVLDKAEYTLVSSVLDESRYSEASDLRNKYNEKEIWYKLTISRPDGGTEGLEADVKAVSPVNVAQMDILGVSQKYSDLKKDYLDLIYNSETGLVKKQKDQLQDMYTKNPGSVTNQGDYLTDILVSQVEEQLADHVKASLEGGSGSSGIILASSSVNEFYAPIVVKMYVNKSSDYIQPYGLYTDNSTWNKLSVLNSTKDAVSFEMYKPGKYLIGVKGNFTDSVPANHWAYDTIVQFNSKYNLADVFNTTGDFNPDTPISIKDSILIMDKVFNKDSIKGESLQKKITKLGLSSYFTNISPVRDLTREQAATLYMKAYSNNSGLSLDAINPTNVIVLNDANSISSLHYRNAENAVALGFMTTDTDGAFNPAGFTTRAEFISALSKALEK